MKANNGVGVKFDHAKREALRKVYKAAIKAEKETFEFEGNEYLVRYAGYLLEYLDMKI